MRIVKRQVEVENGRPPLGGASDHAAAVPGAAGPAVVPAAFQAAGIGVVGAGTGPSAGARGRFPLFEKAEAAGVLATGNCLIVAPTGTGKSYIGRTILKDAALRGEPGVHAYLVPYRALAAEIYESFVRELAADRGATASAGVTGAHTGVGMGMGMGMGTATANDAATIDAPSPSLAAGGAVARAAAGDAAAADLAVAATVTATTTDDGASAKGVIASAPSAATASTATASAATGVATGAPTAATTATIPSAAAGVAATGATAAAFAPGPAPGLAPVRVPRVKIATGDHRDPFYPADTDILVATFERFSALLASPDLRLGRIVIDEVHLLADESRGPTLETLLVRLKTWKRPTSICALSAVISNPEHLAAWLGVPLVLGSAEDRTVQVEFRCEVAKDPAKRLESELEQVLAKGEQAIIFCHSKAASQKVAADLKPLVSRYLTGDDTSALREAATRAAADDEETEDLLGLLSGGVAYHHAGLSRDARACVEAAFRNRHLKVISCTPTLAAGVNLPARLVVVRDIYRMEFIRGRPRRVVLSTGELLNMLGRAGRPGQVEAGWGVALVEPGLLDEHELSQLEVAIRDARGNPVRSRLPDAFDSLMRFLLTVISDRGEATLQDAVDALRASFWYHLEPQPIEFDRPLHADMMEDIPSFARVDSSIRLERAFPVPDGVAGSVASGDRLYNFSLTIAGEDCTCEAKRKWRPRETCKHLACAIHTLLFGSTNDTGAPAVVDEETRNRALYACAHRFRKTLDLGTKIQVALRILAAWGLIEHVPGGYRATGVGAIAAHSGLDLLLLRIARDRVLACTGTPSPADVARWVAEDFFGDETKREKWVEAVDLWIAETPVKKIRLPEKFRGDFERGLEQLGELATVYGEIAKTLGNTRFAEACRLARGCLTYGVAPELIPLAALRIPQLGRARCRALHDQHNIRSLEDLAAADPERLPVSGVPQATVARWVETARTMLASKRSIIRGAGESRATVATAPAATAATAPVAAAAGAGVGARTHTGTGTAGDTGADARPGTGISMGTGTSTATGGAAPPPSGGLPGLPFDEVDAFLATFGTDRLLFEEMLAAASQDAPGVAGTAPATGEAGAGAAACAGAAAADAFEGSPESPSDSHSDSHSEGPCRGAPGANPKSTPGNAEVNAASAPRAVPVAAGSTAASADAASSTDSSTTDSSTDAACGHGKRLPVMQP